MQSKLVEITDQDIDTVIKLQADREKEAQEEELVEAIAKKTISQSLKENVHWFLFLDENDTPFGTCFMQSLHQYWLIEKRFYLSGFYISPEYRGKGHFKNINKQIEKWVKSHGGIEVFVYIRENNTKSLNSFTSIGLEEVKFRVFTKSLKF